MTPLDNTIETHPSSIDLELLLQAALIPKTKENEAFANLFLALNVPNLCHDHYVKAIEDYVRNTKFGCDDSTKTIHEYILNEHRRLKRLANQPNRPPVDTTQGPTIPDIEPDPALPDKETDPMSLKKSIESMQNVIDLTHLSMTNYNVCLGDLAAVTKAIEAYYTNKDPRLEDMINTKWVENHFNNSKNLIRRKANHNARENWPPSLPWHLPSYLSLYAAGPCLICWNIWTCLGGSNDHPYTSTHGINTNINPKFDPRVVPDRNAYGRGPEKFCVVCSNTPGGYELCRSCSPPSHWTYEEKRRQQEQMRQEEEREKKRQKKQRRRENRKRREEQERREEKERL